MLAPGGTDVGVERRAAREAFGVREIAATAKMRGKKVKHESDA